MTHATRFVIQQATKDITNMTLGQKKLLWQGLADVIDQETEVGQLARHNLLIIEQAEKAQESFFEKLNQS